MCRNVAFLQSIECILEKVWNDRKIQYAIMVSRVEPAGLHWGGRLYLHEDGSHEALHHAHYAVAVRESHLHIHLRELQLPVRPQVLQNTLMGL